MFKHIASAYILETMPYIRNEDVLLSLVSFIFTYYLSDPYIIELQSMLNIEMSHNTLPFS